MTDISTRDRLKQIIADECPHCPLDEPPPPWIAIALNRLFAELEEPSEGMTRSGQSTFPTLGPPSFNDVRIGWRAMVQHIRDGGS